ncbi:MAG TPA: winged helix DNA-binding domain-containing protein [Baekduia sp.]|uniref:winged helix DNA-binding domain-containing protein n=1 Tax=Baekduia sp. TaxID=2600305 RepID=UPI002C6D04EE|nr:winged helix DNA-binding domain-containing protein [Baekduia sp.]HMJ37555.1 winged helix DNA-binding domain-containing protein [Baekduia sp.]
MNVAAEQVLAFRLAGQDLATPAADASAALRGWTVQDSPPGTAVAAVLARTEDGAIDAGWLDRALFEDRTLVALYNARTATAVLPAGEAATYATAMLPGDDDAGLKAIAGPALPDISEGFAEPVALGVAAISDALDGATLSRDDLHEALRQRLPGALLPWCKGCETHHARRGLLVLAGLHGRLCLAGRVGRQPAFARTDQWTGWDAPDRATAGIELVRRYLTAYGPSTHQHFQQWSGLGTAHAKALWTSAAGEVSEVAVGGAPAWALTRDLPRLQDPPPAPGVRLLAPGDPLLVGRDREALVPDPALRKQLFAVLAGPGLVLVDGRPAALWRARKQGKRLTVAVAPLGPAADRPDPRALQAAAERLAPHRGVSSVTVETS